MQKGNNSSMISHTCNNINDFFTIFLFVCIIVLFFGVGLLGFFLPKIRIRLSA